MPKYVPEIRISAADHVRREYESHSECGMSDVATDCEVLEANYSKKPKASKPKHESFDDGVLLTDIDGSSDDEKETVVRYPIDCINTILNLGMSCEEVSNSQGPLKKQKSITCSLEKRSKPRTLNNERFDDGGTDVEGMYMSEDDEEFRIDSDIDLTQFEPQAYVSVSDKVITGTIVSPRVTPEPGAQRKKRPTTLKSPVPISSVLTDTEMIISDAESNTTRSKKMTKARPFKTFFDGFASDTEDSDASENIPKSSIKPNKKISCSRSFDAFNKVSVIKNNMLAPIRKKGSDCEQSHTDTEHIYIDDEAKKNETKSISRPSVIKLNQSVLDQSGSTLRHRQNIAKPKSNQVPNSQVRARYQEKPQKKHAEYALNVPMEEDAGNATDIEAFGSDSDGGQVDDIKTVAYLPNPKCEMVIDNESHKGKMSIIVPIKNSLKNKTLQAEELDCGFSDVEDLPGYEPEDYFRYPTPEVPRHTYMTEHSLVENKEKLIDQAKLCVEHSKPEPLTDTEELDLNVRSQPAKSQLKVKIPQRTRKVSECHTDVEDLDGSDHENPKQSLDLDELDPAVLTDLGDFTSDESDDDIPRFTAVTPDLEMNNTYTTAREAMSPFSFEVKNRINNNIPKIRTISPSPIPRNHTDTEDFMASQDSASSNWEFSDDGHIEPHSSVIHIKHTRKFNNSAERDHIKGFVSRPDPTTDVEELTMLEALEELSQKKRKHQKMKEQNSGTVRTCYSGPKGQKINSRGCKSSVKYDHSKGASISKEAVDSSWLSQSMEGGIRQEVDLRSPYDNTGGIYYKEMADQSVYPPHFGYYEIESDVLGSNSSLAPGTDTFSELLFSSSNSESEEPDGNFLISKEQETCGILYDMSSHINKVPELLAKKRKAQIDERICRDSPVESLESRLKYYHELCNRSLSPEVHGVSPAERAELQELEESISQMLIDIRREESQFYNVSQEEATNTIKRRPKRNRREDERYEKINNDGESALKEIESHISKLLQDVEKEEREVMGSLKRDFRESKDNFNKGTWENLKKSAEKLEEDEDTWGDFKKSLERLESSWGMINATGNPKDSQVQYTQLRDLSYTPSPVESSSSSEDEYEMVPKVQLNIGSRHGRSTVNISVQNSPTPRRTKMIASRRSLNRSLPSLQSTSMSLIWKDHNSTECLLAPSRLHPVWPTNNVEYIAPPDHIDPDSGYCVWSYPDEETFGTEATATEGQDPSDDHHLIQSNAQMIIKEKDNSKDIEPGRSKTEKSSAFNKESAKQILHQKSISLTEKVIPKPKSISPEKEVAKKKIPSPEKELQKRKLPSPGKEVANKKLPSPDKELQKKKSPSPEKETAKKKLPPPDEQLKKKSHSPDKELPKKKSPSPDKEVSKKKSPSPEKKLSMKEQIGIGKITFGFKKPSDDQTVSEVKTTTVDKSDEKGVTKKGKKDDSQKKQQAVEDKITKKSVESSKGPSPEKKTGLFGKTLETIKKPFQDKGEEKGKGKGKSKGKEKAAELSKSQKKSSVEEPNVEVQMPEMEEPSAGAIQLGKSGEESSQSRSNVKSEQTTAVSLEDKKETSMRYGNENVIGKQTEPPTTITEKSVAFEPLLENNVQSSAVPGKTEKLEGDKGVVPVPSGVVPEPKDDTSNTGQGNRTEKPELPILQKSIEKGLAQDSGEDVKDPDAGIEKKLENEGQENEGASTQEGNAKEKQKSKGAITAKTEEVLVTEGKTTSKLQETKEASPELNSKGKGKNKPGRSSEGKTQKLGSNLVGKAVDVIKKPFQDQSKKNVELKSSQKEGKGKKQKSVESTKSSSLDEKGNELQSSEMLLEMEQSFEGTSKPVEELKAYEPKEATQKGKGNNGKGEAKQELETSRFMAFEKGKSKSPEKPTVQEKLKASSPEKTAKAALESTKEQKKQEAPKEKVETKSPTKEQKKKGNGKNKQVTPPESPTKEKSFTKKSKQGKKQGLEKQPTIEKAVDIVTRTFIEKPEDHKSKEQSDQDQNTSKTETLIKELSVEESGQQIERESIDLVTMPLGYSDKHDDKRQTHADKLMKELSIEKSGEVIQKEAIDLVAKPLQDLKSTSSQKMKDAKKTHKEEFEHIQKTIDDAKFKLDQFKGIVSDKTPKPSVRHNEDPIATGLVPQHLAQQTTRLDTKGMELPVEKGKDSIIQKSTEHSSKVNLIDTTKTEKNVVEPPTISQFTTDTAVRAVDSIVQQAEKITVDNIQQGEPTSHSTATISSSVMVHGDKDPKLETKIVQQTSTEGRTIIEKTVETSTQLIHAEGKQIAEPTHNVIKETGECMNEQFQALGRHVQEKADMVTLKGRDLKEGSKTKAKDGVDRFPSGTSTESLTEQKTNITLTSDQPSKTKNKTTSEPLDKITGDKGAAQTQVVETKMGPLEGKSIEQKITSTAKGITSALEQGVQSVIGKSNGKKGKGKKNTEAPASPNEVLTESTQESLKFTNQQLRDFSKSADGGLDSEKTTATDIASTKKTIETSSPGKGTTATTTTKDIVGGVGESMQKSGKNATGKNGGKKGKGKNKIDATKQAALDTTSNVAEKMETMAESTKDTMKSVGQGLSDSSGSVLQTLSGGISKKLDKSKTSSKQPESNEKSSAGFMSDPVQKKEQKNTPKEKSVGVGEAIRGVGKDAMEKLSGKKAKGKQKIEARKQQLENVISSTASEVEDAADLVQSTLKSTGETVSDSTTSVVDSATSSIKEGVEPIIGLKDKGLTIAEKSVETTSKPVEGTVKKITTVTKEIVGNIEDGAQTFGLGFIEKAKDAKEKSQAQFDEAKHAALTKAMRTADETETNFGKATASSMMEGKTIITETIQKTDDGNTKIQKTITLIQKIPGESDELIERSSTVTQNLAGGVKQMFTSEKFHPESHAQTSDLAVFETLGTSSQVEQTPSAASSTDEIGRIIKEMESQLLKEKFEGGESAIEESPEVDSDDFTRECRTVPATPMLIRKSFSHELDDESETDAKPVVTTPTLSRRVTGIGGSQRLLPAERPVVRVITEYVGDLHESEPEDDTTYTVLEPEVRERRKFKIRFSPDMFESEEKNDAEIVEVEEMAKIPNKAEKDSKKAEKKMKHIEKKFERMTSQTKEANPNMSEATNTEFQRIVSQLSLEDMDQALHQWDMGGLTPSEVDSKDLTLSSEDTTSPLQQGLKDIFRPKLSSILQTPVYTEITGTTLERNITPESSKMKLSLVKDTVPQIFQSVESETKNAEGSHTLEPEETGETPPIPSPRTPLKTTDSQDPNVDQTDKPLEKDDDPKNYATRKLFWEQLSSGSTESPPTAPEVAPPVPKPRARSSISQSLDMPDEKKGGSHSEASTEEASDIGDLQDLQGITTTDSVARGLTKERTFSVDGDTNSEVEFLRSHVKEDISYDNDAFDDDTPQHSPFPEPRQRKTIYERSVSLPGDSTIENASSVRAKKKIFEAQIKKEMVVEQLISQMEEEGSPERKSFDLKDQEPADQAAMLNRQIHSEIVSHELEEQIESNLLENKALVERKVESGKKETKEETITDGKAETSRTDKISSDVPSIYETKITPTMAEVLNYKAEAISKPSDSLEVHVDKSELEDSEKVKEIEEELKVIEEKYDPQQQPASNQAKVSSITSSQGESEDTFSESDVTPEDARFKEQQDIHVWGPTEKDAKLGIDKPEEQKKQRSVHTPEEHIPDTVWEVPVQESLETVETETVGQLSSLQKSEVLTEGEARKIAESFVEEIENEIKIDGTKTKGSTKITVSEKVETSKKSEQMLKLVRTDTTTSSMEITDEDLRSSGMTDNSPLESQVGQLGTGDHGNVFGEDSGDDIDPQEFDKETIGKYVVDKTLAEVKQSLEAVKEELIEEKKKKRDSITKESPSEFEFKAMVLEKTFTESIQEHHHEEATTLESKVRRETREGLESKSQAFEKLELFNKSQYHSQVDIHEEQRTSTKSVESVSKPDGLGSTEKTISISKETIISDNVVSTESQEESIIQGRVGKQEMNAPLSLTGSEVSVGSSSSRETIIEKDPIVKPAEEVATAKFSKTSKTDSDSAGEVHTENEEQRKSPLEDVFSTSSSSDYKGGSNEASTLDKPSIVIRKHKKSSVKDPKSDGEMYSSSGSHYESFEQTSESIRSPGSRPLSSDIEGLVPNVTGMTTGSSEYESAMSHEISGQSTTITSKEYQTAVSSLSSRDSMKSLDSESSGNLASIEVSSDASETLVPSAMELEKDSEDSVMKHSQIPSVQTEEQIKMQSFSESIEQSVSFDISEDISEDDGEMQVQADVAARMKRSHEMTFQPEPRPIVLEEESIRTLNTSLDDMSSLVSSTTDTGAMRTVRELSRTESERMDGSATSEQFSLTVSATSDVMSLSDSKELEDTTVISKVDTIATQSLPTQQSSGTVQSVTITTSSVIEHGIQSVCTQVTSKVDSQGTSHSNGPTQVDYNAEYDEGDHEIKKRGHRRNGSTSFRPSMIPVFHGRDTKKKPDEIVEDSAESDKYTQPLTVKEGSQEEKKDVDETEKLDEESYKTEADQAMNRDLREGRISIGDCGAQSISMDSTSMGSKSRLPSTAFSEADSEIAELLKQCSSDLPSEDPIERPKTPEPVEECELKDDTPEFSSEAQASVTELEMEYSGAFSRSAEYAAHVSPIREKELSAQESWEHLGSEQADEIFVHSPDPLHLGFDDLPSEKHELETQEVMSKDNLIDRSKSPVPDITITHHHPASCPTPQDSFEKIEMDPEPTKTDTSEGQDLGSGENVEDKAIKSEKEMKKDEDAASESPTSDSFELLEKPDLADEFVIIEEVGREASEQDTEGKSVRIDRKRVTARPASSSAPAPPIESPPPTITKMTQIKYFSSGATEEEIPFDFDSGSPAKSSKSEKESSQEGSPPSPEEAEFKPELEASKKWMEMQFQGEQAAQIFGYDMEYERGPLEDIKEEDLNELEGSMNSKIGSMGSQVSQSIGSYGSVNSSTPDYDVLAGRKYFTRSGEHDDISMNSLQEFERLEHLLAMESGKHSKSLGSQDSLTSSSNSRKHGGSKASGGDDISLASLKEFEGLESACIAAERIEKKAKEEETLLSEIEEGHESQASESESCVTISAMQRGESDEDDYERRMFEIDEIIRQAQTNVEQFMDSKSREMIDGGLKSETLGRADSLEEISKVPELDLDQPIVSYSSGKSYIQQWEDLGDDLITSTDSLELKTQKSKTSVVDPLTTSTDSLEVKISQDVMSVSTDSIEAAQKAKKKDIMTDSIEIGERSSMITSADSLEGKVTQANSIDDDELHATGIYDQSSSSGKEGDFSSSGKEDSAEGAVGLTNRMPPPRAEYLLGSTDSLEPTSSTATHATYQYETDSVMSSSFTSGDSTTMVDDNDEEGAARASIWFDEGKPYVTEVIEPIIGDDEFSHVVHRKVEMPPEIHKVSFKGLEAEAALREYIEKFDPGEDCTETREVDEHGNVHVKRVIQKRVILRPDELGGNTTDLSGPELEKYLQTITQSQLETEPPLETIHTESHSHVTTLRTTTTTLSKGENITEQEPIQTVEPTRRGSRPPLKYDISVDEEPEFDPREHDWRFNLPTHLVFPVEVSNINTVALSDAQSFATSTPALAKFEERDEEAQDGATGYSESRTKGGKQEKPSKK